jgi:hypothetical protein
MGARSAGLAYASATLRDEWSLLNNVGGLAKNTEPVASFAYESRPALPGSNRTAAIFSSPVKIGVIGIGLFRFGDDVYNEQIISAGYSNQFGIASLGLKLNYVQYRADGFGTRSALSANCGGIAQITPTILVGAYIVNLIQPRLSTLDQERLPTKLVAGFSFKPIDQFLVAVEIEKELQYDALIKGGMEYRVHKKVTARTGFHVHPNAAFFGFGFQIKKLKVDYALQYSASMNVAHQASAAYRFEKRTKHAAK